MVLGMVVATAVAAGMNAASSRCSPPSVDSVAKRLRYRSSLEAIDRSFARRALRANGNGQVLRVVVIGTSL
jgi:hypothetical protein